MLWRCVIASAGRAPLTGRARIETSVRWRERCVRASRAPLTGRARIETRRTTSTSCSCPVARPSRGARGLKLGCLRGRRQCAHVARPSRGARGLKHSSVAHVAPPRAGRAPLTGRARIETQSPPNNSYARRKSRGLKLPRASGTGVESLSRADALRSNRPICATRGTLPALRPGWRGPQSSAPAARRR